MILPRTTVNEYTAEAVYTVQVSKPGYLDGTRMDNYNRFVLTQPLATITRSVALSKSSIISTNSSIEVLSPAGVGLTLVQTPIPSHMLTWRTANIPASNLITVQLLKLDSAFSITRQLAQGFTTFTTPNDGSEPIDLTNVPPGQYRFRLSTLIGDQTIVDRSPQGYIVGFSLVPGTITNTNPRYCDPNLSNPWLICTTWTTPNQTG